MKVLLSPLCHPLTVDIQLCGWYAGVPFICLKFSLVGTFFPQLQQERATEQTKDGANLTGPGSSGHNWPRWGFSQHDCLQKGTVLSFKLLHELSVRVCVFVCVWALETILIDWQRWNTTFWVNCHLIWLQIAFWFLVGNLTLQSKRNSVSKYIYNEGRTDTWKGMNIDQRWIWMWMSFVICGCSYCACYLILDFSAFSYIKIFPLSEEKDMTQYFWMRTFSLGCKKLPNLHTVKVSARMCLENWSVPLRSKVYAIISSSTASNGTSALAFKVINCLREQGKHLHCLLCAVVLSIQDEFLSPGRR